MTVARIKKPEIRPDPDRKNSATFQSFRQVGNRRRIFAEILVSNIAAEYESSSQVMSFYKYKVLSVAVSSQKSDKSQKGQIPPHSDNFDRSGLGGEILSRLWSQIFLQNMKVPGTLYLSVPSRDAHSQ